ncbi:MAG: hypothetical protein Q9217_002182 [Psora testacea]
MTKRSGNIRNRFHASGENPHTEYPNAFHSSDDLIVPNSTSLIDDEMTASRSKKRLTAIQELAHDAEAAEEYLRQECHSHLLMGFDPGIRQRRKEGEVGKLTAEPIPIIGSSLKTSRQKEPDLDCADLTYYSSSANESLNQPVYLGQNSIAIPSMSLSHALQPASRESILPIYVRRHGHVADLALVEDQHALQDVNNEAEEKIRHPVKYGTSSEDEGFSLVNFDYGVAERSPPNGDRVQVGRMMKPKSEDPPRAPTPYPLAPKQAAEDSTHVGDLLHYSPGLGRKHRSSSLLTSEIEAMRLASKPSQSSDMKFKTMRPSAFIPDISSELLNTLNEQEKEDYLETAITIAKKNSKNSGIPFLIMKDGRSCVVSVNEYEIELIKSPKNWKKKMLEGSNIHPRTLMQIPDPDGLEQRTNKVTAWERLQKVWRFNASHDTSRDTTRDITNDTYQSTPAVHDNSSIPLYSFGNEKAHRTLGIIGSTATIPSNSSDTQPRKNSIMDSTTDAISIMTFPLRSTPDRPLPDISTSLSPSKDLRSSLSADGPTGRQAGPTSPYKYGMDSPCRQRKMSLSEPSFPTRSLRLRKAASFLSDGSRECPVKVSSDDIGRAMTTLDETFKDGIMSEVKGDCTSITSSTYRGDDTCVQDGQVVRIFDLPAKSSTNLPEGKGLMEKMEVRMKEKKAAGEKSLARAAARLGSPKNINFTGKDIVSDSYHDKEKVHRIKALRAKKPPEDAANMVPIEKTSDPPTGMEQAYHEPTENITVHSGNFTMAKISRGPNDHKHGGCTIHVNPLGLNVPTDDERAHARAITERQRAINEKYRLDEERRADQQNNAAMSDDDSAKNARAFGKSPVKTMIHSIGFGIKGRFSLENRDIHQTVPDHRVKLTPEGWKQAEEAGLKLRSLLHCSDTLHFFTSPYRRTRETTEGILNSLTSATAKPSPFPRHTIKVYEEPRLREQDFGNFQPNSVEMARMWQERANYGHFFYRIPNGESAADAYDRVSGFNESLWRSFGEEDFASVCVLVTHGLMTRVFLMKWYHFSVEYFEDLRNVNHCEFVVMELNEGSGKYVLQNQLRTWSEMREERANSRQEPQSPIPIRKKWGGCQDGDGNRGDDFAKRQAKRRHNTLDLFADDYPVENEAKAAAQAQAQEKDEYPSGPDDAASKPLPSLESQPPSIKMKLPTPASRERQMSPNRLEILKAGRDGGGSRSGAASPNLVGSDDSDADAKEHARLLPRKGHLAMALNRELDVEGSQGRVRADALGDQSDVEDDKEVG